MHQLVVNDYRTVCRYILPLGGAGAPVFPSRPSTVIKMYNAMILRKHTYIRMLGRCTSQRAMTTGEFSGACPVIGADAPALAPRSSINGTYIPRTDTHMCHKTVVPAHQIAVNGDWEYVPVHARLPSAPPQGYVLTACAVHIEATYNNSCSGGAPDSARCRLGYGPAHVPL